MFVNFNDALYDYIDIGILSGKSEFTTWQISKK